MVKRLVIHVENAKEYVIAMIGMTGEIKAKGIGRRLPYGERYARIAVQELRSESKIRKYRYEDASYFRLCDPAGTEALIKISPELYRHFGLLAGEEGNRYKGTQDFRRNRRKTYEIAEACFNEGIGIDFFTIGSYDAPLSHKSGAERSLAENLSLIAPCEEIFLTNRTLKEMDSRMAAHPKNHMYRTTGLLIGSDNVYSTYYLLKAGERWWKDVELQYADAIKRLITGTISIYKNDPALYRNSAIIYLKDTELLYEYIKLTRKENRINPSLIYNFTYHIPMDQDPGCMTKILLTETWKEKTNSLLIENRKGEIGDGEDGRGRPVYNFLGLNLRRMKAEREKVKAHNGIVIVSAYAVGLARELFGSNVNLRIVEEEMLRELMKDVRKM